MAKIRQKKFNLGFWNYNDFSTSGVAEVARWKDLGLNIAMMPYYRDEADVEENLPPLLDELARNDMKMILKFHDTDCGALSRLGEEKYREVFKARYEKYGKHPAVLGFYPGEEPGTDVIDSFVKCVQIMLEIAPELTPFIDLGANSSHMDYLCRETNMPVCGFGNYSQMEPEERGTDDYFHLMKAQMDVCHKYDMDCWPTLLSSAHYRFRAPKEADYTWQINSAAACGCTGIVWFRLYDKLVAMDYRGSPIDEYGQNNGEYYAGMKRAQTRFNIHHGELLMTLEHQNTYLITKRYGGYPAFPEGGHSLIRRAYSPDTFFGYYDMDPIPGIVSFFKDKDGVEYVAVVNNNPYVPGSITLEFDKSTKKAEYVYFNGQQTRGLLLEGTKHLDYIKEEIWLAPGQMEILRIQ